jgi:hypothetical protein
VLWQKGMLFLRPAPFCTAAHALCGWRVVLVGGACVTTDDEGTRGSTTTRSVHVLCGQALGLRRRVQMDGRFFAAVPRGVLMTHACVRVSCRV